MFADNALGVVYALSSALVWGTGDFCGGLASRRSKMIGVVFFAALFGFIFLITMAVVRGETWPTPEIWLWGSLAGVLGVIGIAALYRGLAAGQAAVTAPTSAVVAAAVPLIYGVIDAGVPAPLSLIGMLTGIVGIGLVSRSEPAMDDDRASGLPTAVLSGMGFGGFFIFISQVPEGALFSPLAISKGAAAIIALGVMAVQRASPGSPVSQPLTILVGVFDAGGNIFFLLAENATRLDVAAVLSSMYPVSTIMLSILILKESVSVSQWMGVALCLLAIALIVL
jgi:drug/metabolite transporter (DMT)-like permease